MTIRRSARPEGNFTILDNVIFTSNLSARAIGVLAFLLSKPDHWEVSVPHLVNVFANTKRPDGRDSVYAILAELMEVGFVKRTQMKGQAGKMAGFEYEVFDRPLTPMPETVLPHPAPPHPAPPFTAEPTQASTDNNQQGLIPANGEDGAEVPPNPPEPPPPPAPPPAPPAEPAEVDPFEVAMSHYPKRAGGFSRVDARKAWDARMKAKVDPQAIIDGVKRYAAFVRARGKEHTPYVKQAATFFGPGEHWLGDYEIPNDNQGGANGRNGSGGRTRRESEAERVERINREHDERERAAAGASAGLF